MQVRFQKNVGPDGLWYRARVWVTKQSLINLKKGSDRFRKVRRLLTHVNLSLSIISIERIFYKRRFLAL